MLKHTNSKKILIFLVFFTTLLGYSQLSKTHFIPPLTNADSGSANPQDQYIYISTPSITNIKYTIKPVGQPLSNNITGIVSNANPKEIFLGSGNGQLFIPSAQTSVVKNDRGYIIEADGAIYVSVRMNAGSQAGALVSKGSAALGTIFRVGTYTNENPQSNYLNFVSVMATEDNTQVTFSDLASGLIIKNYSGTTPISATLNKGESYTIAVNSLDAIANRDGLIGTLVASSKPIVVNCGSANGSFGNGGGRDYGIDQIVGLSKVGSEYIFVKGDGQNSWENVLIVAHSNNTSISINGNQITNINAGEHYVIEGSFYSSNGNMYVQTSQPVFAYQGVGATTSEANQGMFFVPPLSCEARGNVDNIPFIQSIGSTVYSGGVTIVTKAGATVTINNLPIANFSTIGPQTVTGNTNYITYKVTGLTGNISVQSTDELYCGYFNFNGAATSGSFYSGFPIAPEINFDAQFISLGNCIPNITLSAANTGSFDSFQWWGDYGLGNGFENLNITTPDFKPTVPGKYKLIGIVACSGLTLESIEIPVSFCPDDIDNDGIIDNLDIDNDNDGMPNCFESRGDVNINLTNILTPQLIFQDNTVNNSIASASYSQSSSDGVTHSFSGNASGNFTSIINPSIDGKNEYILNFNEAINFQFSEDTSQSNSITDDAYFIVKILPVNKNITLLDPDDRLLIDSNFDGVFETGITSISGSEIHFKYNPASQGTTPFNFYANQVSSVTFNHIASNSNIVSTLHGTLALNCFKVDSDNDGIEDSLDYDSDNDGIPDILENTGKTLTLSGVDLDNNGLDDQFDLNIPPFDSDNDGVYDYLDLDSDNDGIYDILESGSGFPDSNFDGIIDNVISNIGANGWYDLAETFPDSNIIGVTVLNTDADIYLNYYDIDSDGDDCDDVIEAGFSDGNNDGFLGDSTVIVNTFGVVTNASDGYTTPNSNYLKASPLTIASQMTATIVCEGDNISMPLSSPDAETIQWEVSEDNGTTWSVLTNNAIYSGVNTFELIFTNTPLSFNGNKYRAFINRADNACGLYSQIVNVNILPKPIVTPFVVLVQCDDEDPTTLGFSAFNLTEANQKISNNIANETISYYLTETSAKLGDETSPEFITNPTTFTNRTINSDVVWARVLGQNGCAGVSEIQLNVSTTTIPSNFLATFNQCDDFLDINGNNNANNNDKDGIATFDFSSVNAQILSFIPSGQNPLPPRYYRNETDALAEMNEILDISNYRNIGYPNTQYIYVRIDSSLSNDCLGLGAYILLTVEPLPVLNSISISRQCDDDTDGLYPFDTSTIETDLLGSQNPTDFNITYWDASGNALPSPLPNPFLTGSQTIKIMVSNNSTSAPDGPCFVETTLDFIVDTQPLAFPLNLSPVCDGDAGDIDNDGLYPFNTSNFNSTILGSQTGMEIYYTFTNEMGNTVKNQTLPNPLISGNQTILAEVINPLNTNCIASTTIDLIVNKIPDFYIETPQIVCSSDPTFTIILDPIEDNNSEIYTYEWKYQDGTILSNASTLTVSTPGTYFITLTKTDGSNCSKTKEIFVNASELATITLNDLTIKDASENNTITINESNLGLGDYEYSLDDEFGSYQDEPFFDFVKAGFHVLYVRDKKGCGTSKIKISVIGYPKYFTPNGDGYNDYWQVLGVNSQFQPNSKIYIFDRYGKLLKQLSTNSQGWDGMFRGSLLPTDDYWFKVILEDGREFTGHFTLKR
ncbi:T9SS type B sorting domain-containing protein [Siansivirga zeaxanthinifaciens]|uniref:Gliding motility protein n=1 Tax=Siansivirga zeaxanthinifaciens CC-SAMT-1 TaxID=1454006 RepID=A0A0C5WHI4_9FLAO|nr:T9SS type B sorting domain-containing protein [Siansivirga zeaxanthinifaciens]AJR04629.1 gliding motility protein [Siansivirga zeaxanthinifaciens CC-SAMT-1]